MATEDVGLKIALDVSGALKSLNSFAADSNKSLNSIEKSFNSINTVAKAAFAFLSARELVRGFEAITSAAAESEAATTKMEVALKLAGDYSASAAKGFEDFASQMQRTSTYTDEAVLKSVALSKTFGTTNEQTKKLVQAAADLASVTGVTLDEAVTSLGKTLDGTAGRLNEQVPALKSMSAAQLQAGAAIDYVATRFKGAAEAASNTYAGSIIKAKNAFDDLLESLGGYITQNAYVLAAIKGSTGLFQELGKVLKDNDGTLRSMAKTGVLALVNSIGILIQFVEILDKVLTFVVNTIQTVIRHFTVLPQVISAVVKGFKDMDFDSLFNLEEKFNKDTEAQNKPLESRIQIYDSLTAAIANYSVEIEKSADKQVLASKKASDAIQNQIKAIERLSAAQREQFLSAVSQNPFGALFKDANGDQQVASPNIKANTSLERSLGVIAGSLTLISKGAEGAVKAMSGLVGAFANTIIPGIGGIVGQIFEIFAQGPDKVREFVDQFIDAIPVIIKNVAQAIPALITEFIKKIPDLINALSDAMPEVIEALILGIPDITEAQIESAPKVIEAMVSSVPHVITRMVQDAPRVVSEMVRNIPSFMSEFSKAFLALPEQFVNAMIDALGKIIPGIGKAGGGALGFIGDAIGGVENFVGDVGGSIGDFFGFRVGAPTASIRSPHTQALTAIASSAGRSASSGSGVATQTQQGGDIVVKANLVMNEKVLASQVLRLNRNGFRLAT